MANNSIWRGYQGLFQEAANDSVFQHNEIHIQHVDHDEGESQHSFLISTPARHVAVHGEESHTQRAA